MTDKKFIIRCLLFAFVCLVILVPVRGYVKKYTSSSETIVLNSKDTDAQSYFSKVDDLKSKEKKVMEVLSLKKIPDEKEAEEVLTSTISFAKGRLQTISSRRGADVVKGGVGTKSATLTLQGEYPDIVNFLASVEKIPLPVAVSEVAFSEKSGTLQAVISIKILYKEN